LIGENSFVKKILEDGVEEGIDWKSINLQIILGEEMLPENLRTYLADILGLNLDDKNTPAIIGSSFGVAEFGLNVFYETHALIRLRRLVQRDKKLHAALIGQDLDNLPALFQYNPLRVFVEETQGPDGVPQIVLTNLEEDTHLPLIRYNIKDEGICIPFQRLKEVLEAHGYSDFLPRVRMPLVAVWGRDKLRVKKKGSVLRPEQVKEILYENPAVSACITGNFRLSVSKAGGPRIEIQSKSRCDHLDHLEQHIRNAILKHVPDAEIILYPYAEFPHGMTLDFERKFKYLPPAPPEPC